MTDAVADKLPNTVKYRTSGDLYNIILHHLQLSVLIDIKWLQKCVYTVYANTCTVFAKLPQNVISFTLEIKHVKGELFENY